MRIASIEISNYKVVDQIPPTKIDENVTALVGRNESGKTAILRSLWKSKNVAGVDFNKLLDYPRGRYSKERKGTQLVCRIEFKLSDEESKVLASKLPAGTKTSPKSVFLETRYQGEDETNRSYVLDEKIENAEQTNSSDVVAGISALKQALIDGGLEESAVESACVPASTIDPKSSQWSEDTQASLSGVLTNAAKLVGETSVAKVEIEAVESLKGDSRSLADARTWAEENSPIFIYFDD